MTTRATRRPSIVKCPGCDKALNNGQPLTHITGDVGGYVETSPGHFRKTRREGKIGWHTSCLDAFKAQNEALRHRSKIQNFVDMYRAFVTSGTLTHDAFMENVDRSESGYTEAEIAEALEETNPNSVETEAR